MSRPSSPSPAPSCAAVGQALHARLRALRRHDAPPASVPSLGDLAAHLGACPACATRHGRALAEAEALSALHARELPVDSLEGFYDGICERAPYVAAGGGMSPAFLDAPRTLLRWRRAAIAASLLLALGTGYALSGGFASGPPDAGFRRLHDPREELLPAYREADRMPLRSGFHVYPVYAPRSRGPGLVER